MSRTDLIEISTSISYGKILTQVVFDTESGSKLSEASGGGEGKGGMRACMCVYNSRPCTQAMFDKATIFNI